MSNDYCAYPRTHDTHLASAAVPGTAATRFRGAVENTRRPRHKAVTMSSQPHALGGAAALNARGKPRALDASTSLSRAAFVIVLSFLLVGTIAFSLAEGLPLADALYLCVATLSTVGYGDVVPKTAAGRLFCCAYILLGVSLIAAALGAALARMQAILRMATY